MTNEQRKNLERGLAALAVASGGLAAGRAASATPVYQAVNWQSAPGCAPSLLGRKYQATARSGRRAWSRGLNTLPSVAVRAASRASAPRAPQRMPAAFMRC